MVRQFRRPRRVLSSRVATSAGGTLVGSVDEVREQILDPPDVCGHRRPRWEDLQLCAELLRPLFRYPDRMSPIALVADDED